MAKDNVSVETSKVGGAGVLEHVLMLGTFVDAMVPPRYETKISGSKGSVKASGKTESQSQANAMREYSRK